MGDCVSGLSATSARTTPLRSRWSCQASRSARVGHDEAGVVEPVDGLGEQRAVVGVVAVHARSSARGRRRRAACRRRRGAGRRPGRRRRTPSSYQRHADVDVADGDGEVVEPSRGDVVIASSPSVDGLAVGEEHVTKSSIRRDQRSPPGSLEICWSTRPVVNAVHMSTRRGSVTPLRARRSRTASRARTAGANDSADGLEAGDRALEQQLVAGARRAVQNSTKRRTPAASSVAGIVGVVRRGHPVGELGGRPAEHGVVDRVLRLEVGGGRRR